MTKKLIILLALIVTMIDARGGHGGGHGGHGHGDGGGEGHSSDSHDSEGGDSDSSSSTNAGYDEEIDGVWYHVDSSGNKTKIKDDVMG